MKPNVKRKNLYSDILDMKFSMWISTKARKCIMKSGSFDNYLISTKPEVIDSRMGLYLRGLIKRKQSDPEFEVPYIPGQASMPRTRVTKHWEYKSVPAIYMPKNVRIAEDHSKYYIKTPQEMSRYEIAELERELRMLDEPEEFSGGAAEQNEQDDGSDRTEQVKHIPEF